METLAVIVPMIWGLGAGFATFVALRKLDGCARSLRALEDAVEEAQKAVSPMPSEAQAKTVAQGGDKLDRRLADMQARNPMRRKSWQVTRQELERKAAEAAKEN